jgi:uncharacterized membrane protein YkvA (DUF1232 family)
MWGKFFKAVKNGEYKVSAMTWATVVGAVVYSIWPLDLIADVIPVAGLLDDLGLWGVVVMFATREKNKFEVEYKARGSFAGGRSSTSSSEEYIDVTVVDD